MKRPYRNGTTHMVFEQLDFISKLVALIPAPRVNLTRFHGIFAPISQHRSSIIIKKVAKKSKDESKTEAKKLIAMSWAARLKRAFNIDIQMCEACGGAVKVIASILYI